jgi:hypothetical protein
MDPFVDLSRAKPHPKDRAVEPDDPMNLHAVELDGDPELMLRILVEEYARMGCDLESLIALCREPFYRGFHGLLLHFGEAELRRRMAAILSRCPVTRIRIVREQPADEQLVQIAISPR